MRDHQGLDSLDSNRRWICPHKSVTTTQNLIGVPQLEKQKNLIDQGSLRNMDIFDLMLSGQPNLTNLFNSEHRRYARPIKIYVKPYIDKT
jgi:hypothetical protein